MKVITKVLTIEDEDFVLFEDVVKEGKMKGKTYYGTIPYEELDDNGGMKRELNGLDMCIDFESVANAIENRGRRIRMQKALLNGKTWEEIAKLI